MSVHVKQIHPSEFKAYGIAVSSRYGSVNEVVEMLSFLSSLTNFTKGVIESIDFDSKSGWRTITLREDRVPEEVKDFCDELGNEYCEFGGLVRINCKDHSFEYTPDYDQEMEM